MEVQDGVQSDRGTGLRSMLSTLGGVILSARSEGHFQPVEAGCRRTTAGAPARSATRSALPFRWEPRWALP